ncbi:O-antigen ligase family protein [Prosthecobacter vanneervenii]|uniref:O-antigen ligase n=1 Tax=Prosthecobacter vanneervenii TaxID=48466 RepID=A0A7W7Y8R0_9BACT|nr:O-antigen ligase family protein [Prosthecobacter vanneervenii]MBB5031718.1 O-antigen ligase [Prosthecobacter vanneervenii]
MEWLISLVIVAPAIYMALVRSTYLLDYVFFVVALNRGIRRLVDFYINGAFNPLSPISLTPLVVSAALLVPAFSHFNTLTTRTRNLAMLIIVALAHGLAIGVLNQGLGAFYALGEWLAGVGAFLYAATAPVTPRISDRWMRSSGYAALVVALYGWYQYYTIPEWDAFWVTAVKFVGYLGQLKPTEMTVFSTLHERGPCASFLAWAAIPMILNPRWRILGGWLTVILLLSVVVLTLTRTMFLIIALVTILQPALSKGKGIGRVLLLSAVLGIGGSVGLQYMPGSERITKRYDSIKDIQSDGSYQGRLAILTDGIPWIIQHPLGLGLGSSGIGGSRMNNGAKEGWCDSGYIEIFSQFGWIGGLAFFAAMLQIWTELSSRIKHGGKDAFLFTGRAVLLGCMVFLYVGNIFSGFSLFWVFLGISLNRMTKPVQKSLPEYHPPLAHPMPWDVPHPAAG